MSETKARRSAWPSQLLRGALGLSFPWLLVAIPADVRFTGPALTTGVALFVVARIASLFEPETLRRTPGMLVIVAEAVFVTLALILALVTMNEGGYIDTSIGAGVAIVIGYLLLHTLGVPLVLMLRAGASQDKPPIGWLRHVIYAGAFVAEETAALTCVSLAAHMHVEARQGPWGLWDLVPIFPIILLVFFYVPLALFEAAAHPRLREYDSLKAAFEGALLQVGAVLVAALTGVVPWV